VSIGSTIRSVRELRQLRIKDLADASGLSPAQISQVERDLANPSISSLKRIANALGVSLGSLVEDSSPERAPVVRRKERKKLIPNDKITYELLSPNLAVKMELIHIIFEENASTGDELYSHPGEEGGVVLQGTMEVTVGTEIYVLEEGDSIYFNAETPHRYRNIGSGKLTGVWAITPPSF